MGQIVDAFATPIIGVLSDHGKCCHPRAQFLCGYGKRKIWHLIGNKISWNAFSGEREMTSVDVAGSICVIVSFPLMFVGCLGMCNRTNELGYLIVLVLLVCVFQFGWAATQISHLAMIPEMSSVESVRDELNIIRSVKLTRPSEQYLLTIFAKNFLVFYERMNNWKNVSPIKMNFLLFR